MWVLYLIRSIGGTVGVFRAPSPSHDVMCSLLECELSHGDREKTHEKIVCANPSRLVRLSRWARVGSIGVAHVLLTKEESAHLVKPKEIVHVGEFDGDKMSDVGEGIV